jgi:subtilisin family serine protease
MKKIFVVLAAITLSPALAHAERFILKNPVGTFVGKTVQTMKFGDDTYVVVEAPRFSNFMASFQGAAETVTEDLQIGVASQDFGDDADTDTMPSARAWHVDAMKYSELPSTRDGQGVVVAVLDTGVDYTHSALQEHMYTNAGEIAANGLDDDGNGFIDDVHGYDFDSKDGDPRDGDSHGTHCAGIIGSSPDAATGAMGVAPGVKIMAVRIIGDETKGFLSNAAAGIKYAADNGAKVISNSWRVYRSWRTFDPSEPNIALLRAAIEYATAKGAIFVAASGNEMVNMNTRFESDPLYPAGFTGIPNFVVVAASNSRGTMAGFSNYGDKYVSVAAPGDNIISTIPGGRFMSMSGTSMATPLVAGAIARGLSANLASPDAAERLVTTSTPSPQWASKVRAGGVIDLVKYLE